MSELPQRLREWIAGAELPALPHVLLKLLRAFNSERGNVAELGRLFNLDVALRSRLLALAASRGNQKHAQIIAIEQSIIALGLDTARTIAIGAAVAAVFAARPAIAPAEARQFWRHAALSAVIARRLAEITQYGYPEEAQLTGLLHDIGQLVLAAASPEQYAQVLTEPDERRQSDLEQQRFGADHTAVGFWLMNHYQLRSTIGDAVLYHHEPAERIGDAHALVRIINAAHALSSDNAEEAAAGVGLAAGLLKLPENEIQALVEEARQAVRLDADHLALDLDKSARTAQEGIKRKKPVEPETTDDDQSIRAQLAEEVRSIVLLSGVRQIIAAAAGEQAALDAISKSAQILFAIPNTVFLIHEPGSNLLLGKNARDDGEGGIDQIAIPFDSARSLIAHSVRAGAPLNSFSRKAELAIIDEQVIRATRSDGILCVPLIVGEKPLGALVLGIVADRAAALGDTMHFIRAFANLAASGLEACKSRQAYEKRVEASQEAEYAGRSRKIVHEVSNPLSIVKNYIKILGMKLDRDDPARQDLDVLNEEIDRVVGIVRSLSDPRKPALDTSSEADPNLVISEVVELCQKSLFTPNRISLKLELDPSMGAIMTDKNGVKQILLNLVKNAAEAMIEGGILTISTASSVNRDGADYAEISVSDTGPGVPPHIKSRLFEPVTSSKGNGHAGLGLAIVKNIVKELHGFVTYRNAGKGSSFEILLPKKPPVTMA